MQEMRQSLRSCFNHAYSIHSQSFQLGRRHPAPQLAKRCGSSFQPRATGKKCIWKNSNQGHGWGGFKDEVELFSRHAKPDIQKPRCRPVGQLTVKDKGVGTRIAMPGVALPRADMIEGLRQYSCARVIGQEDLGLEWMIASDWAR
jgi:hypothetical protein